ncbi:MAG: nickel pincer cofactor biosynthesis protein LarC [Methanotrichaceae archaeon]|nr:nickel pincer cofactor biosynthesis protein LarC [Methanotrichaceae archaeon]
MKVLFFDPFSGASGDMIMGSLIDLGADAAAITRTVESVGCTLEVSRQERGHIASTKATVRSDRRFHGLKEAVTILESSHLPGPAKENALLALDLLAAAESRVHGVPKEEAHFHEIGALDALADIAGCFAALHSLDAKRVCSLPLAAGGGYVRTAHGILPVPAPAVLEILKSKSIPWHGGPVDRELLTPTGTAILATAVDEFVSEYPPLRITTVGYGAGKNELSHPNVLRSALGEMRARHHHDQVMLLETNVDDVTGEVLGYLIELLMKSGALDVSVIPAVMKKGRSGNLIRVIARQDSVEGLAELVMRETGSLGLRVFPAVHRFLAEREEMAAEVQIKGLRRLVRLKVSRLKGKILSVKPEYEDCRTIAEETGLSLREVTAACEEAGKRALEE